MVSYTQTEDRDHQVILLPTAGTGESAINRQADEGNKGEEEEEEYERQQWSFKHEYILSAIGYCVGIGNVWRFPYMCNRNGGGKYSLAVLLNRFFFP